MENLNDKERLVLEAIVKYFILTSSPVASSYIAKHSHLAFSPATIRGIMARLEEKGFIQQPHTSAGRVPTTSGYRLYVDNMMKRVRLSSNEKETIRKVIAQNFDDYESVLKEAGRILAHLSHQLGIIVSPHLDEGIFHRMDIIRLSSDKLLLIVSIQSGMVRTIILEVKSKIRIDQLDSLRRIINERLYGLKLKNIRSKFKEIVRDIRNEETGLIHLFVKSADRIFNFSEESQVYLTGTHHIIRQPEFSDNQKISGVVELLENKNIVIHLFDNSAFQQDLNIKIGEEIEEKKMRNCSIIAARYKIGQVMGTLGIVGPTRMDYCHLVPLVDFTARMLSESFGENWYGVAEV